MKELKAANETLRREMEQIKGGEGYFVTRIEELEALVERVESDKAEAQRALAEWGERGGEEEAKRRREKLIQADEKERLRGDKERLEGLLADADHRAADADGLRRRVDDLESAVDARDSRLHRLDEELREREAALVEARRRCREAQAAEATAKEDTDEAIRIADDMRNSINALEEEKTSMEEESRDAKEKIKGLVEKYEEMKGKAHDAIRQWKGKVKKMEGETRSARETAEALRESNSKLVVEGESLKAQLSTAREKGEKLLNEVECFGEIKSRLEEQLRLAEIQCEESRSEILERTAAVNELRETREALEGEAIALRAKVREAKEEQSMMEERLKEASTEIRILERDKAAVEKAAEETLREGESSVAGLAEKEARLKAVERAKADLEKRLRGVEDQAERETRRLRDEIDALQTRLREAEESAAAKDESALGQQREWKTKVENLKLDVAEKAAAAAAGSETVETLTDELSGLKRDYDRLGGEYDKSVKNVASLKDKLDKREELTKDFDRRLRTLTAAHEELQETLRRKERETLQLFRGVDADLDEMVILASHCSAVEFTSAALGSSSASLTPSASNGDALLAALKPKLKWVANVVARMGRDLNETKTELVTARHRVDSLEAKVKEEKDKRIRLDAAHAAGIKSMEEKFSRLSSYVETHAEREVQQMQTLLESGDADVRLTGIGGEGFASPTAPAGNLTTRTTMTHRPMSGRSEISPRSKDEIEKRYRGYRETVDNLQRDVIEVANATPRVVYARTPSPVVMRGAPGAEGGGGGDDLFPWTSTPARDYS